MILAECNTIITMIICILAPFIQALSGKHGEEYAEYKSELVIANNANISVKSTQDRLLEI